MDAELFLWPRGAAKTSAGAAVAFSVLWSDAGMAFRHIIDYTPFPQALASPPGWPLMIVQQPHAVVAGEER